MNRDQTHIQRSLLDRLIDLSPEVSRDSASYRTADMGQIKGLVARDLEKLLNTKSPALPPPPAFREVARSLHIYGLSDFTSQNPKSAAVRQRLRMEIEQAIRLFEPRLRNVSVRIEATPQNERNLRFKITGLLVLDPVTEPVAFDTIFDVGRGEYAVSH